VTTTDAAVTIGVHPLTVRIGAEITGVDAGEPQSDETIAQVRAALVRHKVVFLRDQHLDYPRQVAFAERFGTLTLGHPTLLSPKDKPHMEEIDSHLGGPANQWHTDVTFCDRPPAFTFLHGVVMPEVGGDTIWPTRWPATRACPSSSATWPTRCGSCTPMRTTTPSR